MSSVRVVLTARQAVEVQTLLSTILTNSDQWEEFDLRALRAASIRLQKAIEQ